MEKPVYLKNSELLESSDNSVRIIDYELLQAVSAVVGDSVKCLQLDRDLWRIYLHNKESRQKLLQQLFEYKNQSVSVYDTNPYSSGALSPRDQVLKVTVSGIPLSVQDTEITNMLKKFNVKFKSELRYENIRNPETGKMTSVLNGNRFIYISPLPDGKALPRTSYCAGLKCRIHHFGQFSAKQELKCRKCWQTGHYTRNCQNETCCKVCKKPGHEPGDTQCEFYQEQTNVIAFQGYKSILSNFHMSEIKVYGENHKSAEHAFQMTKAIRNGDLVAAEKIRSATTALDAKRIGDYISKNESWEKEQIEVMSTIIDAKASQIKPFQEALQKSGPKSIIAEATYDDFWGTGINVSATVKTNPEAWPSKNMLGIIIKDVAKNYRRKPRSWSLPRQPNNKAARVSHSQKEITDFVSQLKEGPSKRSRENVNDDADTSEQG